jgi:hypothetical protein
MAMNYHELPQDAPGGDDRDRGPYAALCAPPEVISLAMSHMLRLTPPPRYELNEALVDEVLGLLRSTEPEVHQVLAGLLRNIR